MNYQFSNRDQKGITFEAPLDPTNTIRFTRSVAGKTVDGLRLQNVRSEIIVNRQHDPRLQSCVDCSTVREPLSARITMSGSTASAEEIKHMLNTLVAAVNQNVNLLVHGSLPAMDAAIVIDPTTP